MMNKLYQIIYKDLKEKLLRVASWALNDPEEAKDVVHDVFIKLIEKKLLKKSKETEYYAIRMVKNLCIDIHRRKKFRSSETDFSEFQSEGSPDQNLYKNELQNYVNISI